MSSAVAVIVAKALAISAALLVWMFYYLMGDLHLRAIGMVRRMPWFCSTSSCMTCGNRQLIQTPEFNVSIFHTFSFSFPLLLGTHGSHGYCIGTHGLAQPDDFRVPCYVSGIFWEFGRHEFHYYETWRTQSIALVIGTMDRSYSDDLVCGRCVWYTTYTNSRSNCLGQCLFGKPSRFAYHNYKSPTTIITKRQFKIQDNNILFWGWWAPATNIVSTNLRQGKPSWCLYKFNGHLSSPCHCICYRSLCRLAFVWLGKPNSTMATAHDFGKYLWICGGQSFGQYFGSNTAR